jgi:nucleoside-diphosphate-sugar epimerase
MRVFLTGASSVPGERVLRRILEWEHCSEVWCSVRNRDLTITHPKVRKVSLDLNSEFSLDEIPRPVDLVVHFAAVTHAADEDLYRLVNFEGTVRLAEQAQALGCKSFFYLSTRCASPGCGAYGESKLAAENALKQMAWDSLLILQPAELYGGGGREGVDQFIWLAAKPHVIPMLWGHPNIQFAPLHIDDFVECTDRLLQRHAAGLKTVGLCGPEELSGVRLAWRLARTYFAVPIPVWWPFLKLMLRAFSKLGWQPVTQDQVLRLAGPKTASVSSPECALSRMTRFPQGASA